MPVTRTQPKRALFLFGPAFFGLSALEVLITWGMVFALPHDRGSLLGYSPTRTGLLVSLLAAAGVLAAAAVLLLAHRPFAARLEKWVYRPANLKTLVFSALIGLITGVYLLVQWIHLEVRYEYQVAVPRLLPAVMLVCALCAQAILLLLPEAVRRLWAIQGGLPAWLKALASDPRLILRWLMTITLALAALSLAGQALKYFSGYYRFLDFAITEFYQDSEMNLPTFYSSFVMALTALFLASVGLWAPDERRWRGYWLGLAVVFLFLATDDICSFHEMLTPIVQDHIYAVGLLYWPWFLPVIPVLILLGLVYLRFFLRLPARTRAIFFWSGVLFLTASIGMEAIGAWYADEYGLGTFVYVLLVTVEETAETAAMAFFACALIDFARKRLAPSQLAARLANEKTIPVRSAAGMRQTLKI